MSALRQFGRAFQVDEQSAHVILHSQLTHVECDVWYLEYIIMY